MKFLLVSRKKYEDALKNNKKMNEERKEVVRKNIELQQKNKELEGNIQKLKQENSNLINELRKIKMAEKKENRKERYSNTNTFRQCKSCGRIFKVKSSKSQRCTCDKCIEKNKKENG